MSSYFHHHTHNQISRMNPFDLSKKLPPHPRDLTSVSLMGEPNYWELVMYDPKWD